MLLQVQSELEARTSTESRLRAELESETAKNMLQMDVVRGEKLRLEEQLISVQDHQTRQATELKAALAALERSSRERDGFEEDLKKCCRERTSLKSENDSLSSKALGSDMTLKALGGDLDRSASECETLKAELASLKLQLEGVHKDKDQMISQMVDELTGRRSECAELRVELEKLKNELASLSGEKEGLVDALDGHSRRSGSLEAEVVALEAALHDARSPVSVPDEVVHTPQSKPAPLVDPFEAAFESQFKSPLAPALSALLLRRIGTLFRKLDSDSTGTIKVSTLPTTEAPYVEVP